MNRLSLPKEGGGKMFKIENMVLCWGCSTVVECLPSMSKDLGLIPAMTKSKKKKEL
jgi:hypothetical protein